MLNTFSSLSEKTFKGLNFDNEDICTLELTVATGLEEIAAQEIREKLFVDPLPCRGRVLIDIATDKVKDVLKLRSIDHVFIVVHIKNDFVLNDEREKCFIELYHYSSQPDWKKGLRVWQSVSEIDIGDPFENKKLLPIHDKFCQPRPELDLRLMKKQSPVAINLSETVHAVIASHKSEEKLTKELPTDDKSRVGPKFRVSCHRVGTDHKFGSPEAARQFGAGVNEMFDWSVDLKNFDMEIHLNITDDFGYVTIGLTKSPLFKRNITFFGPTNLRATICYNMIALAKPQPGDIVIDPMCGGCTIPMEGALTYNKCFYMGGDNVEIAVTRSVSNINNLETACNIDVLRWDCTKLPLRNQCADIIVSDFPFGKRSGNRVDNRVLYYKSLIELARITRLNSGRAILLTHDRNSMAKNLSRVSKLWKNFSCRTINIGGLAAAVYLLHRTSLFSDPTHSIENDKKRKWESTT